jgi:hypothetical protein
MGAVDKASAAVLTMSQACAANVDVAGARSGSGPAVLAVHAPDLRHDMRQLREHLAEVSGPTPTVIAAPTRPTDARRARRSTERLSPASVHQEGR